MTCPPLLVRLRVQTPAHAWPTLWLPVFLLWPLGIVLLVPLAPVVLVVAIVLDPHRAFRAFELAVALFGVVCGLRGLRIDITGRHHQLLISFH